MKRHDSQVTLANLCNDLMHSLRVQFLSLEQCQYSIDAAVSRGHDRVFLDVQAHRRAAPFVPEARRRLQIDSARGREGTQQTAIALQRCWTRLKPVQGQCSS